MGDIFKRHARSNIQVSGPLRYRLVEGLDVLDGQFSNAPRRYNGALSQELLVIRENHETGERSLSKVGPS